jgi:coenzyme F420-reducing hydrogenase gamma subunit
MDEARTPPKKKLKVGVFKFASCDGCQLQLIDMAEELALLGQLLGRVDFAHFLELTSEVDEGPYDLAIVEGSISTEADLKRIREIRNCSRSLVTIGACATSGGIQALRNWRDSAEIISAVYARPEYIDTLADSTAIGDRVVVDFELRGCPVDRRQLREVVHAFLTGRRPQIPKYSVCMECKRRGNVCVTVARGEPCLGPITQAGCGAICPAYDRGCYGCFGAMEQPNLPAQIEMMRAQGMSPASISDALHPFAHTPTTECATPAKAP